MGKYEKALVIVGQCALRDLGFDDGNPVKEHELESALKLLYNIVRKADALEEILNDKEECEIDD